VATGARRDRAAACLLSNIESSIQPGFPANGEFGHMTMSFPDFSLASNNQAC
jgi:hypothetical protein